MSRMGILKYDVETPLDEQGVSVSKVQIPLSMHIGAPSVPVVKSGDWVAKGQLIAEIPEKNLGARIHASIAGVVTSVTSSMIEISAQ
jgi:Na+-translocating ferredoxin:NAD+ oxidoreductase RnfC subunit